MSVDTIAPVDVNAAFAATRERQLASIESVKAIAADRQAGFDARVANGGMKNLGNGRYEVTEDGWDKGEVFTVGKDGIAMPQHGLDMSTGQAALYTTVPAWHSLGNVVPGGTSDIDQVLKLGRIDFEVERRPVLFRNEATGPLEMLGGHFVTARSDTGAGLGVVGSKYEVLQNRQAFEFLQDIVDRSEVTWESAGAVRDGRRVFVSMRLPEAVTIDAGGVADQIEPFIVALNSHDGSSPFQVVVTPWRPVCRNTERFALRDAQARWTVRHTLNARDRFEEARRTLGLSSKYFESYAAEENTLAQTEMAMAEFRKVCDELWGTPEPGASKRALTSYTNRATALERLYIGNAETLGRTAYAAERAITEYLDHKPGIRPSGSLKGNLAAARATRLMEGSDDEIKTKAHRQLMTLTNR